MLPADLGRWGWCVGPFVLGLLFLLFFFLFPFFLGTKLGLFLLFPLAFVFASLVTHICFSFPTDLGHAEYSPPSTPIDAESRVIVLVVAPTPIQ